MDKVATIVFPVFGLIGVGYLISWSRILDDSRGEALSDFVFVVAIPLLILRILATADFAGTSAWRLWLVFFSAFALSWALGTILIRQLFARDARAGLVAGLAASYGNTTLVGIPLVLAAYGTAGAVPMALIVAVQLPAVMTVVALLMRRAERRDDVDTADTGRPTIAAAVAKTVLFNPIVIGLAAGGLWRLSGVPFAGLPADLISRLADVAGTLALFAMGMSLRRYGVRRNVGAGLVLTLVKLLVMPALVLLLARAIDLPPVAARVMVIAAACPTGVTPFLVAGQFRTGEALASNTITVSTILAVASVAFWLHAVDWLLAL